MEIKGILFDKDGTLIDFYKVWGPAAELEARRRCEERGCPYKKAALMRKMGVNGEAVDPEGALACKSYEGIALELAQVLGSAEDIEQLSEELGRLFYEEVGGKLAEYPTFVNTKCLFRGLQANGIKVGLATTDDMKSTRSCMACLDVLEEISFWGVAGENLPEKPDIRLVEAAARQWDISSCEIAVVGDTPNDMRFAKNAGAVGIAVRSGVGTESALEPLADFVIDSVAQLEELVDSINKSK